MSKQEQVAELEKFIFNKTSLGAMKSKEVAQMLVDEGFHRYSENIIELPCKVGDVMYVNYKDNVYPVTVNAIRIDTKKNNHRICVWGTFHLDESYAHEYKATFPFDSIGKSLFYTDLEADMKGE